MSPTSAHVRRLAAASALFLVAGSGVGLAGAAHADPSGGPGASQGQGHGKGGKHRGGQHRGHGQDGNNGKGPRGNNGKGPGDKGGQGGGSQGGGSQGGSGSAGGSQGGGRGGSNGDPAGNNGTVKIAPLGEFDGIPNNSPHPGCTFLVEWYGFDEGADIVSTVSFAMQAPTSDVGLSVDGPSTVFVGGDPASGAGTDSGLDGRQAYTLSFDGEPHPKQGYHVKLTVNTPRSNGSDKKSKVFWVEPCDDTEGETPGGGTPGDNPTDTPGGENPTDNPGDNPTEGVEGTSDNPDGGDTADQGVLSEAEGPDSTGGDSAGTGDDAAVPTSVDAGEGRNPVVDAFTSPWGLAAIVLGLLTAIGAFVLRRRSTSV